MLDPAAVLAFFVGLYTGPKYLIENPVVSGILGGRSDKLLDLGMEKIKGIWNRNKLPQNADLLRAVREAHFGASLHLIHTLSKEMKKEAEIGLFDGGSNGQESLVKLIAYLKKERSKLHDQLDPDHDDPAFRQIEHLLSASQNHSLEASRAALKKLCKERLTAELEKAINGKLPAQFSNLLENGWDKDGLKLDWFDIFCLKFADILKDEKRPRVSRAFQDRLTSDIRIDTISIKEDTSKLIGMFENGQEELMRVVFSSWSDTERWLEDTMSAILNLQGTVESFGEKQLSVLSEIDNRMGALPREILRIFNNLNAKEIHGLIDRILELQTEIGFLKQERAELNTELTGHSFQAKGLGILDKQLAVVQQQLDEQRQELQDANGMAYAYIIIERNITLHLKDSLGKIAICEDELLLNPLVPMEDYVDVFLHEGKIANIKSSGGKIISQEKEGGLFKVTTKFDKTYAPGESISYTSSCEYLDSHTEESEYFSVWSGFPLRRLNISVIFPPERLPAIYSGIKKIIKFDRTLHTNPLEPIQLMADGQYTLHLSIDRPGIFDRYRIDWSW